MTSERSRIPCLSAAAAEGTGKKQQEGRAMATLDRKVPSPEAFLGKPWSSWIDAAKLHCSDNVDLEEAGKEGGKSREVMRLNKEDMHLFGHYPAHDDFYLVVCSACNQVVKPQVFQSHCEGRKSLSSRTLDSCPPSALTAVCGQVCPLLHMSPSERLHFGLFRASVLQSTGERRQQSSAGRKQDNKRNASISRRGRRAAKP
ncbi:ataxin-7-like protein 1 isoform 6-T6 [Urocitellus parryii]|uniref:Ataxin 7 like 1 n=1 Tax=Urocitellus parryii TaxID=9999 RepID=A0A8D2HJ74_UROPR